MSEIVSKIYRDLIDIELTQGEAIEIIAIVLTRQRRWIKVESLKKETKTKTQIKGKRKLK